MGANIVRRLMKDGHDCVVYDVNQDAVAALAAEGATGASSIADLASKLQKPRAVWLMIPAGLTGSVVDQVADSARVGPTAPVTTAADTTQPARRIGPPISPKRALFQSLLIPGWGQASLDRNTAGGLFVALEVTSIAMLVQSKKQLSIARDAARDSVLDTSTGTYVANPLASRVRPRKRAVEDWTALLVFSHLIAAADAFVAAHLWDVPIQVQGHEGTRSASISTSIPF